MTAKQLVALRIDGDLVARLDSALAGRTRTAVIIEAIEAYLVEPAPMRLVDIAMLGAEEIEVALGEVAEVSGDGSGVAADPIPAKRRKTATQRARPARPRKATRSDPAPEPGPTGRDAQCDDCGGANGMHQRGCAAGKR